MGSMIWWRSSVGTALQPLVLGPEFLAPDRRKLRMTKPAFRSRILAKSSGDVLAVRGSSSSKVHPENAGGDNVLRPANQALQAPQGLDKVADGEIRELISRWTAGRREFIATSAAVFSSAVCACCLETVGAVPDPDALLPPEVGQATVEAAADALPLREVVQATVEAVTEALPSPEVEQATVEAVTDALPPAAVEQSTAEAVADALPPPEVEQAVTDALPPPEVEQPTVEAATDALPPPEVEQATVEAATDALPTPEVEQATAEAATDALPPPEVEQATVEAATDALPPPEVEQATVEAATDALPPPEVEQATVEAASDALPPPEVEQATVEAATDPSPPPEVEQVTVEAVTDPSPEVEEAKVEAVADPLPPPEAEQAKVEAAADALPPPEVEQATVEAVPEALPPPEIQKAKVEAVDDPLPPPEVEKATAKAVPDALSAPEVGQAQAVQDKKETEKKDDKSAVASQDWDYGSLCGPSRWGSMCAAGVRQSPIDFELDKVKAEKPEDLIFDYSPVAPTFLNTGHGTMQVNFPDGRNRLRIGDRVLDLIQFHFHTPSEHSFNGEHYCMEAHLVHRDPISKSYAVVGVMLDAQSNTEPNRALQAALEYAPTEHLKMVQGPRSFKMSPALLLPPSGQNRDKRRYMHYTGSLTTPPCSEGVEWYVMETPVSVSSQQVLDFMKYVGDFRTYALNTRPVQPLGNRIIGKGKALPLL